MNHGYYALPISTFLQAVTEMQAFLSHMHMSRVVRKLAICICENKGADQLCSNCTADQRLCFRYIDSTIPLLPKSEISRP